VRAVVGNAPVEGFGPSGAGERSREPKGEEGVRWAARLGCWRGSGSGRGEVGRGERLGRPERGKGRRSWVGPGCWVLGWVLFSFSILFLKQTLKF